MIKLIRFLALTMLLTVSAVAANVTWTNSTVTGDSSILNNGTQLYGYALYQDPVTQTINGASFVGTYLDQDSNFSFNGGTAFHSYQTNMLTNPVGYSAALAYIFNSANNHYDSVGYANPYSVSFTTSGLTIGNQYDVQFLIGDDRSGNGTTNRQVSFTGGSNTSSIISIYDSGYANSIVGRFTAEATTQAFTLNGTSTTFGVVELSAFQVRDLGVAAVPEPSVWFLSSAALLLHTFIGRRRIKRSK